MEVILADTEVLKEKAFALRREVFVIEQEVSTEDEFDDYEELSHHYVVLDEEGNAIGAARWRKTENGIKLERFAVKEGHRGTGIGSALVEKVLEDIREKEGEGQNIYLHAQLGAVPLYQKYGFQEIGDQFLECDIWHYLMRRDS